MKSLLLVSMSLSVLFFSSCADKMASGESCMQNGSCKVHQMGKACPKCDNMKAIKDKM